MCLFRRKNKKATKNEILPIEEIVEIMYNKSLSFSDEVVDVIYCPDKTKRFVVLKRISDKNFSFLYEELSVLDADELRWMITDSYNPSNVLPAYWTLKSESLSIFGTLEEALNGIRFEPEYKLYFISE